MNRKFRRAKEFVKRLLKRALPAGLIELYRGHRLARRIKQNRKSLRSKLIANYSYDLERFLEWSAAMAGGVLSDTEGVRTRENLKALMTMEYHRIEKGLSLRETRTAFGRDTIRRLISGIRAYQKLYGVSDEIVQISVNTLLAYYDYNLECGYEDRELCETITDLKNLYAARETTCNKMGGVRKVTRNDIWLHAKKDLSDFFASRHSIRDFTTEEVDMELIERAVEMAQKSPSVCNRQSTRLYVVSREGDRNAILSLQNGNRGFGDRASKVLIVASDLQNFASVGERNQCWIDGGMYAMSLVYALHSLGLGTCCLNWSVEREVDQQLRKAAGIRGSEAILMMIAVGHMPDEFLVAQSPRKKAREVMTVK